MIVHAGLASISTATKGLFKPECCSSPLMKDFQSCSCYPVTGIDLDPVTDMASSLTLLSDYPCLLMFIVCLHYRPQLGLLTMLLPTESVPCCPVVANVSLFLTGFAYILVSFHSGITQPGLGSRLNLPL